MTESLQDLFEVSMVASGTPDNYQKALADIYNNNIDCAFYEGVQNKYIVAPTLNLCKGFRENLPSVIKAVYERETMLREQELEAGADFDIRILVNMLSIDDIHSVIAKLKEIGVTNVHTLVVHSNKRLDDGDELCPEIDGRQCTKEEVFDTLDEIDSGTKFAGEPVLIFQVDMISEGINIKSVSACIIQSNANIKIMQQCGRPVRNQTKNGISKVDHGHASIYCLSDNTFDVVDLLEKLTEFGLDDKVFKWGQAIENTGGTVDVGDDEPAARGGLTWCPIDLVDIKKWKLIFGNRKARSEAMDIPHYDLDDNFVIYLANRNTNSKAAEQATKDAEKEAALYSVADDIAEHNKEKQEEKAALKEAVEKDVTEVDITVTAAAENTDSASASDKPQQNKKFNEQDITAARKQIATAYTEIRKMIDDHIEEFPEFLQHRDMYLEYYWESKIWAKNWKAITEKNPSLDDTYQDEEIQWA